MSGRASRGKRTNKGGRRAGLCLKGIPRDPRVAAEYADTAGLPADAVEFARQLHRNRSRRSQSKELLRILLAVAPGSEVPFFEAVSKAFANGAHRGPAVPDLAAMLAAAERQRTQFPSGIVPWLVRAEMAAQLHVSKDSLPKEDTIRRRLKALGFKTRERGASNL